MLDTIEKATENFCVHQMGTSITNKNDIDDMQIFITYIDVKRDNSQNYRIYIMPNRNFIQNVAEIFLDEAISDEKTLKDMALETANLIVGSAKVLAQSNENNFVIETPHFENIGIFHYIYDNKKTLSIDSTKNITLAIKEIDV